MSSGQTLADEYQQDLKHFLREQHGCPNLLGLDQEVPHTRSTDADFVKSEVKVEDEPMDQPPQVINFFVMDETHNNITSSSTISNNNINSTSYAPISTTSWLSPYSTSTSSFSSVDPKDSLNTPTPYNSNAVNGLRWQTEQVHNDSSRTNNSAQSFPPLSSASFPSIAAASVSSLSVSSSLSSSLSSVSSNFSSESPLVSDVPASSWSNFTLADSRFSMTPPPSSSSSLSSSSSSLSSSPPESGSFLMDFGFSPAPPATGTSFNVTNGLAGSGCTIVSNGANFLSDPPQQALHDDILEYTDLDKQPFSFYEDLDTFGMTGKQSVENPSYDINNSENSLELLEDPALEHTIRLMHDSLQKDSEALGIPFDPMQWSNEHVQRWISSVCQKKKVTDIPVQLYSLDGPTLCSLPASSLQQHGELGKALALGIDFYKAASSFIPSETSPVPNNYHVTGSGGVVNQQQYHQHNQRYNSISPCVSPAPSQAGSSGFSTQSDNSDDETGAPHNRAQRRHHSKKGSTTHLWEFLKELLLSGDPEHADCIRWIDRQAGVFKIEDSKKVATLWGRRKNRPLMNYDKLSRSVRQYYRKGIIKKTQQSRRLVYQFCDGYL